MKEYIVKGRYKQYGKKQQFKKKIEAQSEKRAKDKTYALMGSEHKLKRNQIKINEVKHAGN